VLGKRIVNTRLHHAVTVREENAAAAFEVMVRFAVDARWLIHLPPTMSPAETSARAEYLEHPDEALAYYRAQGVDRVVCEAKHMGSRAVVVVCRDADVARRRFGVDSGDIGCIYTRTGRRFFSAADDERTVLDAAAYRESGARYVVWSGESRLDHTLSRNPYDPLGLVERLLELRGRSSLVAQR